MARCGDELLHARRNRLSISPQPVAYQKPSPWTQDTKGLGIDVFLFPYMNNGVFAKDNVEGLVLKWEWSGFHDLILDPAIQMKPLRTIGSKINEALFNIDSDDSTGSMISNKSNIYTTSSAPDVQNVATCYVLPAKYSRNLRWASGRQKTFAPYQFQSTGSIFWVTRIFFDFIRHQSHLLKCTTCSLTIIIPLTAVESLNEVDF